MSDLIYHITSEAAWEDAKTSGRYVPIEFLSDGFIHACFDYQLKQTADFFFSAEEKKLVLEIDVSLLGDKLVTENTLGGEELFPHIYSELSVSAVLRTFTIQNQGDESGYETSGLIQKG